MYSFEVVFYDKPGGIQTSRHTILSTWGDVERVETLARCAYRNFDGIIHIPALNYINDPHHKERQQMSNYENVEDIAPENHALWCEIKEHSFSAKDPNKMLVRVRGENRLACGPCTGGLFQAPGDPKSISGAEE
jgi:hypothetical protein